jgi:two-component system phosphate regulon sensor histidine kinase PhoR
MALKPILVTTAILLVAFALLLSLDSPSPVQIVLIGFATLVSLALADYVRQSQTTKELRAIADAVAKIRAGELSVTLPASPGNVGVLATEINALTTKLRQDLSEMKKLQRVRSEFLGNVSHELRTPIFSLQGFLETLLDGAVDDPHVNRDFLTKAYTHSQRLNTLLGELITISQIESGEMKMSFRYFNLATFLSTLIDEFRPTAEQYHARLQLAAGLPRDVEVQGDKERLRVVFENLIENAIKYNKPNGEVILSYEPHDAHVTIRVSDTGVGIAKEHQARIFERFYRVDTNRSREVGGTGLGLAIVKHIVEAHGSAITVTSEFGQGSTFTFDLKR